MIRESASREIIRNFFVKRLRGHLNDEFGEYCSEDDYSVDLLKKLGVY